MSTPDSPYRGRFAPSPTGPLHLGSLIAALASYLDARAAGGRWLLRMEDIDPPREQPGAAAAILCSLEAHGLCWDEPVLWQSERSAAYLDALDQLRAAGALFACTCSRAQTDAAGNCRGDCRTRSDPPRSAAALRVAVAGDFTARWEDRWQGAQRWGAGRLPRDFVVRRRDGLFAYQLAVVVDDAAQGITHVVRGSDLLDSTPRQLWLQRLLHQHSPAYSHLPVLTNREGQKLSKQTHAPALDDRQAAANLRLALDYLGQPRPPAALDGCDELLRFAIAHWRWQAVPAVAALAPREA
jgi:glutamyl-Q tRNA(Asp) synthetase